MPMDLDATRRQFRGKPKNKGGKITEAQRTERMKNNLCLYCGKPGRRPRQHWIANLEQGALLLPENEPPSQSWHLVPSLKARADGRDSQPPAHPCGAAHEEPGEQPSTSASPPPVSENYLSKKAQGAMIAREARSLEEEELLVPDSQSPP
ncbi:hypothetical protein GJ744_010778 [Endocarpon pusillum]|uniref:CCHC-type domain-containing protein n=1 Tax=Endocarpon pusillum TaxID=364733 RepID=A0A8H7E3D7_9EURO|nr:hypothetical protein GJ744_010778 [Endocarpon pusillum]